MGRHPFFKLGIARIKILEKEVSVYPGEEKV